MLKFRFGLFKVALVDVLSLLHLLMVHIAWCELKYTKASLATQIAKWDTDISDKADFNMGKALGGDGEQTSALIMGLRKTKLNLDRSVRYIDVVGTADDGSAISDISPYIKHVQE